MLLNDILEITSATFKPFRNDENEGLGSGQLLSTTLATPLWSAEIVTPITEFAEGRKLRARLNALTNVKADFYIYDPIGGYPANDPTGTILAASTVTVSAITDGKFSLAGLPAGFTLEPGDYFAIDYGSSPVRRGFFEVSETVVAAGGGVTPLFQAFPFALPGINPGAAVTLIKPQMKAKIVPGGLQHGGADSATWKLGGFSFTVMQKL